MLTERLVGFIFIFILSDVFPKYLIFGIIILMFISPEEIKFMTLVLCEEVSLPCTVSKISSHIVFLAKFYSNIFYLKLFDGPLWTPYSPTVDSILTGIFLQGIPIFPEGLSYVSPYLWKLEIKVKDALIFSKNHSKSSNELSLK